LNDESTWKRALPWHAVLVTIGTRERDLNRKTDTYFSVMCPWTVWIEDASLVVDIAGVEKFVEPVPWFASVGHVPSHRVQLANALGEFDMGGNVEAKMLLERWKDLGIDEVDTLHQAGELGKATPPQSLSFGPFEMGQIAPGALSGRLSLLSYPSKPECLAPLSS
jgi:hypothetical protein